MVDLKPAIFLDRDGTLIRDVGYCADPEDVELLEGVPEALRTLRANGFVLVLASNQSGVGRGLISTEAARLVDERFESVLRQSGATLDACYYCPHAPADGCQCRKPSPGMILAAAHNLGLAINRSFMVGDKMSDVEAGRRAGCRTILLDSNSALKLNDSMTLCPDLVAGRWTDIVAYLLANCDETI